MRVRRGGVGVHPVPTLDRAHLDRAVGQKMVAGFGPGFFREPAAHVDFGFQIFGRGHLGHLRVDMVQALFDFLEAGGHAEDRAAFLAGNNPAVGK